MLGYYGGIFDLAWDPQRILLWAGNDTMILAYAAGLLIVPAGLCGLAWALVRPESRAERAFAALTVGLAACLVGQAALFSANGNDAESRVHERYLFGLLTLLAVAFALELRRGMPRRRLAALLAGGLLALSAVVPLAGYTQAQGATDSPTLRAVAYVERSLGAADASLLVAALAALLAVGAAAAAFRPERAFWPVVGDDAALRRRPDRGRGRRRPPQHDEPPRRLPRRATRAGSTASSTGPRRWSTSRTPIPAAPSCTSSGTGRSRASAPSTRR